MNTCQTSINTDILFSAAVTHPGSIGRTQGHHSISQIQCYVSVITEKHDLSFQLTYHTLTFDFQTTSAEGHALLYISRIQTVVLDLYVLQIY